MVMQDGEAFNFGTKMRSTYGASWQQFFFELDVAVGSVMLTVHPNDVIKVLDQP